MKILILLLYYNRPNIVKNALYSIKDSVYKDWELACIDDYSDIPLESITKEILNAEELAKTKFYNTLDSLESKRARGDSIFGSKVNEAIKNSDADICIMLCDDDYLLPNYLGDLNDFYSKNDSINYAYSHIILFNPIEPYNPQEMLTRTPSYLSYGGASINPVCQVDASQVSWRRSCNTIGNCWFPEVQTYDLDAAFFRQLYHNYGNCPFTGVIGQAKGWFSKQLCNKRNQDPFSNFE